MLASSKVKLEVRKTVLSELAPQDAEDVTSMILLVGPQAVLA